MMVSGIISVPSATNEHATINVSGSSALSYATIFANTLNGAESAGMLLISDLDTPIPAPGAANGDTLEYTALNAGETGTIATGGAYLLSLTTGSTTVTGSGDGDTVLAATSYGAGGLTYLDTGGSNNILFVSGNNNYDAIGQGLATPNDTITAGSGQDNITTGPGFATVFSGTGRATFTLKDSDGSGASGFNDIVLLNDGVNTVNAQGVSDLVVISAFGQVVNGGANAAAADLVVISAGGDDLINAGAANFTVTDAVGGNTIAGGTGLLTVATRASATGARLGDVITGASGPIDLFGAAGAYFTLSSTDRSQQSLFVAGQGAETLSGAGSSGSLIVFANASGQLLMSAASGLTQFVEGQDTTAAPIADTIVAGTGGLQIFGGNNNDLTLTQGAGAPGVIYVAGTDSETIQASALTAPMTVFGGNGGNLDIQAGLGGIVFIGGTSFAQVPETTVTAGAGGAILFGNDGDVLTLTSTLNSNATFYAGEGNETLDGSHFFGSLTIHADNAADPINGGNVNESVIGGAGPNYFYTGSGYETFVASTGVNAFQIDETSDGLGGNITIYNYASADAISFAGFTKAQEQAAIKSAAPASDGIVGTQIMLSDQTTVLFVDTAASGLTFKL